jgi:hypothetical protein
MNDHGHDGERNEHAEKKQAVEEYQGTIMDMGREKGGRTQARL